MSGNQVKEYLRAVEEMVMDEEKIVTYKLLSRTLSVNVNTAKQLLYLYLTKQQNVTPCTISATHLIAGVLKDGTFLVSISCDNKLDETYSKYDKITSEHVYSIQKGKASGIEKNSEMLFVADSSLQPPKSYPIKYHKILKEKTDDKVKKNTCQDVEVKADVKQKENKASNASNCKDVKQKAKKPVDISNFFNNQSQRKKVDKQEKTEVKSETIKTDENDVSKNTDKSEDRKILVSDTPDEEESKEKPSSSYKPGKKVQVREKKKRKRIVSASEDSESDEEGRDAILCGEPEVPQVAERLRISDDDINEDDLFENKRKRKKVVNKTVLHDDGFMETFSEVVYETDSDGESPKERKKEAKTDGDEVTSGRSAPKIVKEESVGGRGKAQAQKSNPRKQATLFSFFKKN